MRLLARIFQLLLLAGFSSLMLGLVAVAGVYAYFAPQLPAIEVLRDVRLQVPLKVYSRDHELIAEFGEKRRTPFLYKDIPVPLLQAFLSAEDDRFFEHPGVDYQGILRAVTQLVLTGEKKQGGSTITMQVARNFFLTSEKTYERKIKEILLALKIERSLSKEEIFELYLNKIYLGNRAYGVGAAAEVYYGKPLKDLDIAQMAMIAGLPKAPSRFNPIINPDRAILRRDYVLQRMQKLGYLDKAQYDDAIKRPITAFMHAPAISVDARYAAEMVRSAMVAHFGESAYTEGYVVETTLDRDGQQRANQSLRMALEDYDRRHGYRGPEGKLADMDSLAISDLDKRLESYSSVGGLLAGIVVQLLDQGVRAYIGKGQTVQIDWQGMLWARSYIDENTLGAKPEKAADILKSGDIIRLRQDPEGNWQLAQIPDAVGAIIALNPQDGSILSLVGGYDFFYSKFNRAIQSKRQPGSGFKPVLYTTALEAGFTPATTINDAPIVFEDASMQGGAWRPENYSGKFFGPTRLREALYKSRNLVSVRLIDAIGIDPVRKMAMRMGFDPGEVPRNLTIALGSVETAPMRMSAVYSVFANGGYRIKPYLIKQVANLAGETVLIPRPFTVCEDCIESLEVTKEAPDSKELMIEMADYQVPGGLDEDAAGPKMARLAPRILSPQVHYQITSMLKDVIRRGTARRALKLGRTDLAGKTGTTNDQYDAWFNGFNRDIVVTTWVGFDRFAPLGKKETGGRAALPMWMDYMENMLKGSEERDFPQPDGMVTIKIDPETGLALSPGDEGGVFETFRKELVPESAKGQAGTVPGRTEVKQPVTEGTGDIRENLF